MSNLHFRLVDCVDELYSNFMHGYFDVVLTHYGSHNQARELVEGAVWVMKTGGEGIFCGRSYKFHELGRPEPDRPFSSPLNYSAYYEILHEDAREKNNFHPVSQRVDVSFHWTYHIKKR